MTNVITLPSPRPGVQVQPLAQTPAVPQFDAIHQQQAIENALAMALYHIRHGESIEALRTATAKATRAASLLKHACESAAAHTARA